MTLLDESALSAILKEGKNNFHQLTNFFEGDSRILKESGHDELLIEKLKPTIFSREKQGPTYLPRIDLIRQKLNVFLCAYLQQRGVATACLGGNDDISVISKEDVAPIEVVVKGAQIGSPKHLYYRMENFPTRSGIRIQPGNKHKPYVRFDWRNPLPREDTCMPEALANEFIDIKKAKATALKAYHILAKLFSRAKFELLDICFFMNKRGDVICAEVSSDNCRFDYTGEVPHLKYLFNQKQKEWMVYKASILLMLLSNKSPSPVRLIFSGPFCTGKTSIIKALEEDLGIKKLVDDSSRTMRPGEKQGFPYHFISEEKFIQRKQEGQYYEWVKFNNSYYGVPKNKVMNDAYWTIDILSSAFSHYKGKVPGVFGIFLEAPDDSILIERAQRRGDSPDQIKERLQTINLESSEGFPMILAPTLSLEEKIEKSKEAFFEALITEK